MKIQDAIALLQEMEQLAPETDIRLTVPYEEVKDHLKQLSGRPVFQMSAWSSSEVVFNDRKKLSQN